MYSGKSFLMGLSAVLGAMHSPNAIIGIYEPSNSLIKEVAMPAVEYWLQEFGFKWERNLQDNKIYTKGGKLGHFTFKTTAEPDLLIAYSHYQAHIDELDTLPVDKAKLIWQKVLQRNRQNPEGLPLEYKRWNENRGLYEPINRASVYSTPEGYKFCYDRWVINGNEKYQCVHANTRENPYATEEYIQSILDSCTEKQAEAYLNGQFVNMASGSVYYAYDKAKHESVEYIKRGDDLHIGMDFNMDKMAATVYVKRNGGKELHAVAEITNEKDTRTMIKAIKDRWGYGHKIYIYPDASGKARNVAADTTSLSLLAEEFNVRVNPSNPKKKERILLTNKGFEEMRIFVNSSLCPTVSDSFKQQPYNKHDEPDKNHPGDHQNDASTYPIAYIFGVSNRISPIPFCYPIRKFI